jgi:putative endonuclease
MFYAYILKSLKDGGFYYGSCERPKERIKSHNAGKVRSTKSRRPLVLHYVEEYPTKKEAIKESISSKVSMDTIG